ncbi:hypothetical protein [uncultured Microbacterium sp.]|uniref:hypothetical protein n=1 Tax=uncultured Microbacterium sp. TaxID=191216 RepID=UPI0025FE1AD3|nr:hypothetical protein [uncultured Microbacterium sp.]
MIPADWTPHRRDDRELLGWIRPDGESWRAVDVLGREITDATDWLDAEEALEAHGIAWLADPWILDGQGDEPLRVRIVEVVPEGAARISVKVDDFGDMQRPPTARYDLPWTLPSRLRPPAPGDPDGRTLTR